MPGPSKGSTAAVEAGRRGAAKRWGETPRVIRLSDLPSEQAAFVAELVAVARKHMLREPRSAA